MGIIFFTKVKNRVSLRLLAQIRGSQVFWEQIKKRVSPRSALLKAVYLEALLYDKMGTFLIVPSANKANHLSNSLKITI